MRRVILFAVGFISIFFLSCSNNADKQDFYGTYLFDKIIYLSPLSSSTVDYANQTMAGTRYIIEADSFKIELKDNNIEISSPSYIKEDIKLASSPLFDGHILQNNGVKYQYDIKNKDGSKAHRRLYVSNDCLWIATYADNTADGSEIIMDIVQLSK